MGSGRAEVLGVRPCVQGGILSYVITFARYSNVRKKPSLQVIGPVSAEDVLGRFVTSERERVEEWLNSRPDPGCYLVVGETCVILCNAWESKLP